MAPAAVKQSVRVGNRVIELSNLTKPLWPDDGITKGDLITFYAGIAHRLLPHLFHRPLTLTRYPNGINKSMFYQKDTPEHAPDWLPTFPVYSADTDKEIRYLLADEPATLVWLANQGTIEIHPWMSRIDVPDNPDYAVIDLDPSEGSTLADAVDIAHLVHTLLEKLGLVGFPKLSGATGIHIYVPIAPRYSYQQTSRFVGYLGKLIEQAYPEKATTERLVRNRGGKVYIDHLQNLPGKTIVAPYVPRPIPGAPVSVPVHWDELGRVTPQQWTVRDVQRVLARPREFDTMYEYKQSLDRVLQLMESTTTTIR